MTQQTPSKVLYDLLVTRNFDPTALPGEKTDDSSNNVSYKFDYKAQSGKDYGTAVAMINAEGLTLYFGDNLGKGMDSADKDGWFNFLGQLKNLAMSNRLNGFHIQDLSKLKYSMQGQAAIKEGLFESWAGTKTRSWNGMETEARLMIKHKRVIGENDARYRYIESLFVETAEGERYKLPFTKLAAGRSMVEHVRQGGKPYDIRGNHIAQIVEEMNVLSRFKRANQGKIFEGVTAELVESAGAYYENLQHNLKSLSTRGGYARYFEAWDPAAITDEDVIIEDLRHMFVEQNIDSRVEQALPLLAKLQREQAMKEANIFESWANLVLEGTIALPDTKEKQAQLIDLLSQELPVGPDAINATGQLADLFNDDELFDRLSELASENADADARDIILSRLEELKDHPDVAQVIGQLANSSSDDEEPEEEMSEGGFNQDGSYNTSDDEANEFDDYESDAEEEDPLIQLRRSAGMKDEGVGRTAGSALGAAAGLALVGGPTDPLAIYTVPAGADIGGEVGDWAEKKIRGHGDEHSNDYEDEDVDEGLKHIVGAGALAAATALGGYAAGSHNSGSGFSNTKGIEQFNKPTTSHVQPLKTQADLDRYNKTRPSGTSKLLNLPSDFEEDEEVDEGAFADALKHLGGAAGTVIGKKLHPKGAKGGYLTGKAIGDTAGQYLDNKVDKFFNRSPAAKSDTSRPRPDPAQEKPAPAQEKPETAAKTRTGGKKPGETSETPEAKRKREARAKAKSANTSGPAPAVSESGSSLEGQYGHSGKMKPVTGGDADTLDRLKFLSGITK